MIMPLVDSRISSNPKSSHEIPAQLIFRSGYPLVQVRKYHVRSVAYIRRHITISQSFYSEPKVFGELRSNNVTCCYSQWLVSSRKVGGERYRPALFQFQFSVQ